jgi:phage tail sheath protein FI
MPITPTYPGVYIEEIPSGVRTITGVATSIAAFIDFFRRGLMNRAVQIFNMGDFEREFGGLEVQSEASYGIQQFFLNGGTEAWVVRTASGGFAAADVQIRAGINGATALTVQAGRFDPIAYPQRINPGTWGNNLRVSIDYPTPTSGGRFNMTVSLVETRDGQQVVVSSEVFRGLSMNPADLHFVQREVNDEFSGSKLVRVIAAGNAPPLQTGTLSGVLNPFPAITDTDPQVTVTIGTDGTGIARLLSVPTSLAEARGLLESAIRAARPELRAFSQATVSIVDNRLRVLAGPTTASSRVIFSVSGADPTATALGLSPGTNLDGVLSDDVSAAFPHAGGQLQVTIGGSGPITLTLGAMADLAAARTELETQVRAAAGDAAVLPADAPAFAGARVVAYTDGADQRLIVLAGIAAMAVAFTTEAADPTATDLGLEGATATAITALVSDNLAPVPNVLAGAAVNVTIGAIGPQTATTAANANTLAAIAAQLQVAMRAASPNAAFTGVRVATYSAGGENRLVVLAGIAGNTVIFAAAPLDATTVAELRLNAANGAEANVQTYALGAGAALLDTAQGAGTPGADGVPPDALALIGDLNAKTGIHALEDVDLFNILCIPRAAVVTSVVPGDNPLTATAAAAVIAAATTYCERRRAFFVVDTPTNINEVQEVKDWLDANATLRHRNAALYFPRVQIPDPLNGFRLRSVGASGTMAGLYARTDGARGVWKAPAGTETTLTNVQQLEYTLTDPENGTLNPLAINCLRTFPVYGTVSWGARTLVGADQQASEWKYVPVRRLALFLEESLYRGTQWVVFEPNDEPLWAQIRLNVGAFMHNLFRQGAFQGRTPREAYLVKCDKETTTQNDINLGIVNILVGFAPLKPAEFVIVKIQQLAGQIAA